MDPQIGQVINNKYRLERLIGDGGMGSVFEARHELLGTTVALKFLHTALSRRKGLVERFLQEAQVSARIKSEHVARVSDVDRTPEGLAYMVMEFVAGDTLQERYENLYRAGRRLTYGEAFSFTLQLLEGVGAAHTMDIVHRDLKPDNVMLTEHTAGRTLVKILDFGIAKLKATGAMDRGLTRPGVVMGTPEYMAPEQAFSADKVDARADIFSLGVMFYEMLAGRRPVAGESAMGIAAQYLEGNVTDLRSLAPSIAPPLAQAVHCAMGARPEHRFNTVDEFRDAISPFAPEGPADLLGPSRPSDPPLPAAGPPAGYGAADQPGAAVIPRRVPKTLPDAEEEEPVEATPEPAGPTPDDASWGAADSGEAQGPEPVTVATDESGPSTDRGLGGPAPQAAPSDEGYAPGATTDRDGEPGDGAPAASPADAPDSTPAEPEAEAAPEAAAAEGEDDTTRDFVPGAGLIPIAGAAVAEPEAAVDAAADAAPTPGDPTEAASPMLGDPTEAATPAELAAAGVGGAAVAGGLGGATEAATPFAADTPPDDRPAGATVVGEPFAPPGFDMGTPPGVVGPVTPQADEPAQAGYGMTPPAAGVQAVGTPSPAARPGRRKNVGGPSLLAILLLAGGVAGAVVGGIYLASEYSQTADGKDDPIEEPVWPTNTAAQAPPPAPEPTITDPPEPDPLPEPPPEPPPQAKPQPKPQPTPQPTPKPQPTTKPTSTRPVLVLPSSLPTGLPKFPWSPVSPRPQPQPQPTPAPTTTKPRPKLKFPIPRKQP